MRVTCNDNAVFLVPLLGIDTRIFDTKTMIRTGVGNTLTNKRFFDSFLTDDAHSSYDTHHIFIAYYLSYDSLFEGFEMNLEEQQTFKESYDLIPGKLRIAIFEILDEFKPDYDKFIEGKFSQYSKKAKEYCTINYVVPQLAGKYPVKQILPAVFKTNAKATKALKERWENFLTGDLESQAPVILQDNDELWTRREVEEESLTKKEKEIIKEMFTPKVFGNIITNEV